MKIAIRVDASVQIGIGHVMRCMTLADVLKDGGAQICFVSRHLPENLRSMLLEKGHEFVTLDTIKNDDPLDELTHSHWLSVSQKQDASDSIVALSHDTWDWLIVDHYALDKRWETRLRQLTKKILVIDDIADRKHECDLLLDQTYGRNKKDYKILIPVSCELLLGSQYALLRSEFFKWRKYSLKRRAIPKLKNILISMGGIDQNNVTGKVIDALKNCGLPKNLTVTVIIGSASPNIENVIKTANSTPFNTEVKMDVNNMAELMANADLAIGAAGATTWERCCLGLPSIQIVIADNQLLIAKNLRKANIITYIDNFSDMQVKLKEVFMLSNKMSILSAAITDGQGCKIVCDYILSKKSFDKRISLKPIQEADCDYIYSLQSEEARKYSRNPEKPTKQEHKKWFLSKITDESTVLFVILFGQQQVGMLRFDNINNNKTVVSINIESIYSGRGIAKESLSYAFSLQPESCFKALVHKENIPSKKVFEKLGFIKVGEEGCFNDYEMSNL